MGQKGHKTLIFPPLYLFSVCAKILYLLWGFMKEMCLRIRSLTQSPINKCP